VDLEAAWWTIPSGKTKNKLAHRVPLSTPAVELLRELRAEEEPAPEAFVFKGYTRDVQTRSGKHLPLDDFQPRDLRKTVRTMMSEGRIPSDWAEQVINHKAAGIRAVYDLHTFDQEKRQALDWWAARLDAILKHEDARVLVFAQRA
jgi:integrase